MSLNDLFKTTRYVAPPSLIPASKQIRTATMRQRLSGNGSDAYDTLGASIGDQLAVAPPWNPQMPPVDRSGLFGAATSPAVQIAQQTNLSTTSAMPQGPLPINSRLSAIFNR